MKPDSFVKPGYSSTPGQVRTCLWVWPGDTVCQWGCYAWRRIFKGMFASGCPIVLSCESLRTLCLDRNDSQETRHRYRPQKHSYPSTLNGERTLSKKLFHIMDFKVRLFERKAQLASRPRSAAGWIARILSCSQLLQSNPVIPTGTKLTVVLVWGDRTCLILTFKLFQKLPLSQPLTKYPSSQSNFMHQAKINSMPLTWRHLFNI